MENSFLKKLKAITLLEMLVYIAIFTSFIVIIIQLTLSVSANNDKIKQEYDLEKDKMFISNHLDQFFDLEYREIDINTSVFNDPNGRITDGINSYFIENNILYFSQGEIATALNSSKSVINSFTIYPNYNEDGEVIAVSITIEMRNKSSLERITSLTFVRNII